MLRTIGKILLGLVVLLLLTAAVVYQQSSSRLQRTWPVAAESPLVIPTDSATIARGAHLFLSTATCAHCHGIHADGGVDAEVNPVFVMSPPNLTRGKGGIGDSLSVEDWERAIRHGVRANGTSLMVMPSDVYRHLSDTDVTALIAYLQQVPPVDRAPVPTRVGPVGRALLAAGQLQVQVAPRVTPHASVDTASTDLVAQGKYLANISGCHGCHNPELTGGRVPGEPPSMPAARNITPAGIGTWSEADFRLVMREGKRPDGTILNPFMPWQQFNGMTDDELHAIWLYVRSFPAKES